jgi:hypothetical protein
MSFSIIQTKSVSRAALRRPGGQAANVSGKFFRLSVGPRLFGLAMDADRRGG